MLGEYNEYNFEEADDERTIFSSSYHEDEDTGFLVPDFKPIAEKPVSAPHLSKPNSTDYWQAALKLVYAWGEYLGKKKLYINATHPETAHRVQKVVDDSFKGSTKKLKDRENETSENVNAKLSEFDEECKKSGVETVSRYWLYEHLKNGKDTKKIRGKITSRKNSAKPAESLKNLI